MRWAVLSPFFYQPGGAEQFAHLVAGALDARLYVGEVTPSVLDAYPGVRDRLRPSPPFFRRTKVNTAERILRNAFRRDVDGEALLLSGNFSFYRALFDRRITVAQVHAPPEDPYGVESLAARKATFLTAHSRFIGEMAERVYRRAPDLYIPAAIDLSKYHVSPPGPRFLTGGRLVAEKRFDRAIRGAGLAGVALDVFGDGPARPALERLARELGGDVTFHGRVPEKDRIRLLHSARAFIFTSQGEPWGLTPAEAMATGKTVLASRDCGGPMEYLHEGEDSLFFSDEEELATLLADFDDSAAIRRAGRCRTTADGFDARLIARMLNELVEA